MLETDLAYIAGVIDSDGCIQAMVVAQFAQVKATTKPPYRMTTPRDGRSGTATSTPTTPAPTSASAAQTKQLAAAVLARAGLTTPAMEA